MSTRDMLEQRQKIGALIITVVMIVPGLAINAAQAQTTSVYDARGNKVGSTTTLPGGRTDFYDSRGNRTGSSFTTNGRTDFYDSRGNRIGPRLRSP